MGATLNVIKPLTRVDVQPCRVIFWCPWKPPIISLSKKLSKTKGNQQSTCRLRPSFLLDDALAASPTPSRGIAVVARPAEMRGGCVVLVSSVAEVEESEMVSQEFGTSVAKTSPSVTSDDGDCLRKWLGGCRLWSDEGLAIVRTDEEEFQRLNWNADSPRVKPLWT
jgi:hypothetical protein